MLTSVYYITDSVSLVFSVSGVVHSLQACVMIIATFPLSTAVEKEIKMIKCLKLKYNKKGIVHPKMKVC